MTFVKMDIFLGFFFLLFTYAMLIFSNYFYYNYIVFISISITFELPTNESSATALEYGLGGNVSGAVPHVTIMTKMVLLWNSNGRRQILQGPSKNS